MHEKSLRILLLFIQKNKKSGFTLVEVVVSLLLTLIFAAVSAQVFVASTALKIRAQELSESNKWIQADLENVKARATQLDLAGDFYLPSISTCLAQAGLGTDPIQDRGYAARLNGFIEANAAMSPTNVNEATRMSEIGSRPYTLTRTLTNMNVSPYNRLIVSYNVTPQADATDIIASYSTEIMPDASLVCPAQP